MKDKNSNKVETLLMMSVLLQGTNPYDMYCGVGENLNYLFDEEIIDCTLDIYFLLIEWLSEGLSYEEIEEKIDNLDLENFKKLTEDKQKYIKEDINDILIRRRQMKGNDRNE